MDTSKVMSLLEQLDDEIDDLEEVISPLVKAPLSVSASKLPLLDKAKLYVLVAYAIESILFCRFRCTLIIERLHLTITAAYLRLLGVKAREHPVFRELTRVKQYFQKIKAAENPVNQRAGKRDNLSLDKGAAQRIIAAGLVIRLLHPLTEELLTYSMFSLATIDTISNEPNKKLRSGQEHTSSLRNCQSRRCGMSYQRSGKPKRMWAKKIRARLIPAHTLTHQ
jgi:hypothetical protein